MKNFIKNEKQILIVVFILSIIIRILYLLFIEKPYEIHTEYIFLGNLFSNGDFLANTADESKILVGPGIPLIYALFKTLFSEPFYSFVIYNIIVSSFMVIGLFYLGKELFNNKIGLLLAIWGMLFPESIRYIGAVLKEPTLLTLIPFFILVFIKSLKKYHYFKTIIAAALLFSLLIHIDERFFIYLPFLLIAVYFYKRNELSKKFRLKKSGILFGLILIFMLPWGIRNYLVYNQLVLLTPRTTSFTSFLWGENYYKKLAENDDKNMKNQMDNKYKQNEYFQNFVNKHNLQPRLYGKWERKARAFINFWQPTYIQPTFIVHGYRPMHWSTTHNITSLLFYGIFLPFYIIGLFILYRRKLYLPLFIGAIPVIHSLLHAYMVWPLARYRTPVTCIVVMVGIWTILEIYSWFKNKYIIPKRKIKHYKV